MVANIFEDFEPPSKKFIATPLPHIRRLSMAAAYLYFNYNCI